LQVSNPVSVTKYKIIMKKLLLISILFLFPVACSTVPDSPYYSDGYVMGFTDGYYAKENQEKGEEIKMPTHRFFFPTEYQKGYVQGFIDGYKAKEREIEILKEP